MAKLPCRISYHPNKENPTSYYTYVPHPHGKHKAIRELFPFWGCEEAALQRAINFSNRKGTEIWGWRWKQEGRLVDPDHTKMKGRASPKGKTVINGVRNYKREYENSSGYPCTQYYWAATWYENGRPCKKQFSYNGPNKRTSSEAKQLAIEHRKKMEKLHYRN